MDVTVGTVLEGKVTGIMKFGAFVSLPGGKSGLVHISEIAYTYVNQVSDHLQVGQEVKTIPCRRRPSAWWCVSPPCARPG